MHFGECRSWHLSGQSKLAQIIAGVARRRFRSPESIHARWPASGQDVTAEDAEQYRDRCKDSVEHDAEDHIGDHPSDRKGRDGPSEIDPSNRQSAKQTARTT